MPNLKFLDTSTQTHGETTQMGSFHVPGAAPGILLAHSPLGASPTDRCLLSSELFTVGRSAICDLTITDTKLSSRHFRVHMEKGGECLLEDLGSTNGTYLLGFPVKGKTVLPDQSVIRAGRCIFVFHQKAQDLMRGLPVKRFGMEGRFHTPRLLCRLEEAALSDRNILLSGGTGSGKELAAHAIAEMIKKPDAPGLFSVFNAARFASREEAASTLFGVVPRFFSNVDARAGLIEQSDGGVLFIDEIHNLPEENQRMLLRVMENGEVSRLGETKLRQVNVRFILASNAGGDTCGLARDLFNRLRLVPISPLNSRIADVPMLFQSIFKNSLARRGLNAEETSSLLTPDHFEALCLENYEAGNIRKLVDLSDRLTTRILVRKEPNEALREVFGEHFGAGIVAARQNGPGKGSGLSRYEQNKHIIVSTYREARRNLSLTPLRSYFPEFKNK